MILIFIACLVWLPALVGLGGPLVDGVGHSLRCGIAIRTAIAGLMGMFAAATVAAAANFFVAIYPVVSSFILVWGWMLIVWDRRRWVRLPWKIWRLVLGTIFVVALIDARGIMWYDTGLYHLQAVQWCASGALPRGLANLYECLGYNCSWFVFAAAVETPLLLGKSCFVVNAIVAILIALPALDAGIRGRSRCLRADRVLLFLMPVPLAQFSVDVPMMSSLAPDLVVMLLIVFSVALWVRSADFLPVILIFSVFAVMIKLSAVPFLVLAVMGCIVTGRFRIPIWIVLFCLISVLIFLVRGIWISGYAAYPAAMSRLAGLNWAAPPELALHAAKEIQFWSRYNKVFEHVQAGSPWVAGWFNRVALSKSMWISYVFFCGGMVLVILRRPVLTGMVNRCMLAMVGLVPAMAFWFQTAPQVRFGYGYIFAFAGLCLAMGLNGIVLPKFKPRVIGGLVFGLLLLVRIDRRLLKMSLVRWPEIPVAVLDGHRLADGTEIITPRGDDRVWNAERPATVDIAKGLRCVRDGRGRVVAWVIDRGSVGN